MRLKIEDTVEDDLSEPSRVHHKAQWKHSQDAVCRIHLAMAQEKGLTFWQTGSHAIYVLDSVPPDCIEKVVSEKDEKTLCQRLSTPRPAPRIILKNAWHQQLQHQQLQQGTFGSCWKKQERPQGGRNSDREGSTWTHVAKEGDSFQVDHRDSRSITRCRKKRSRKNDQFKNG